MKPSWDDAPEWAQWLAMDEEGQWCWYECEPHAIGDMFCVDDGQYENAGEVAPFTHSLEMRPC